MKLHPVFAKLHYLAFAGLMVGSAGIAVLPVVARPPLTILYGKVTHRSRSYSHRPGSHTVERMFYRVDNRGRLMRINSLIVAVVSTLFYTWIFFVLWSAYYFGRQLFRKKE